MQLSIIIPVYQAGKYIEEAMRSLLKATREGYEIILIDDCSSDDGISKAINVLEGCCSSVRLIRLSVNKGYGNACNLGIDAATGEYIAFFEPDDIVPSGFYEQLLSANNKHNCDIVKYDSMFSFKGSDVERIYSYKNYPEHCFFPNDYPRMWMSHPSITNCIYKTEFLRRNNISFPSGGGASYQDTQFSISLYYSNPRISIVTGDGYLYRRHESQSIQNLSIKKFEQVVSNWKEEKAYLINSGVENFGFYYLQWLRQLLSIKCRAGVLEEYVFNYIIKSMGEVDIPFKLFKFFNIKFAVIFQYYKFRSFNVCRVFSDWLRAF
jgi:glycosyltransferase